MVTLRSGVKRMPVSIKVISPLFIRGLKVLLELFSCVYSGLFAHWWVEVRARHVIGGDGLKAKMA